MYWESGIQAANQVWWIMLVVMNVVGFAAMGFDKWQAVHKKRRISEKTLLTFAFLLGSFGCYAGMRTFRHKTQKPKFALGIPALMVVNITVLWWLMNA